MKWLFSIAVAHNYKILFIFHNHLLREEGAKRSSSTLAKFAFPRSVSLLFSFPVTESFLLGVICLLLLPPKKLCPTPPLLEFREPLVPKLSPYDLRSSGPVPLGCGKRNSLFCTLASRFALRDGKITSETSGMHSCHILRYLASLGTLEAPSSKKDPLASTSQFCCFAQRFLIWSVTWLESVLEVSGKETAPG